MPQIDVPDSPGSGFINGQSKKAKEPYNVEPTNWYKSLPYGFAFWDISSGKSDKAKSTMWLPISPSNITTNTPFATNIITTLYGVIEEHSEVRYYDITIAGTTGFAPRFVAAFEDGAKMSSVQSTGRSSFQKSGVPDLGGFLPEITNTINQVLDVASDIGGALSGGNKNPTGIDPTKSGYVAFHNLYKYFLKYKEDAAQITQAQGTKPSSLPIKLPTGGAVKRQLHPIQFLNYKDGIKYDCVPLSFTLVRSADKPMEYQYNIKLRCFNLQNVSAKGVPDANQLDKLGLGGITGQKLFSTMTGIAGNASTVISGLF